MAVKFDYQTITAAVARLDSAIYDSGLFAATQAIITCEVADIRYTIDGSTDPAEGHKLVAGNAIVLENYEEIQKFQCVRADAVNAIIRVTYENPQQR